jgi:methylthioribose-1-phosphate isomerase
MKINGRHYRTIWEKEADPTTIQIIDQRRLPHELVIEDLRTVDDAARAIREMHVRGAPLIGATAAYGLYIAALEAATLRGREASGHLSAAAGKLRATRPTAVDLFYAIDRMLDVTARSTDPDVRIGAALEVARAITEESVEACRRIGVHGLELIEAIARTKAGPVHILTHCNAGWLACVDYGTATAPIYLAHDQGIDLHVWVDETRPRNQGARLTAYELLEHGVPHAVIPDNTGGHLMQNSMVDLVITGTDRTTRTGDVANKIGTYLKALAARDNDIPFYVALPSSTIDWSTRGGVGRIPIEERDEMEVKYIRGMHEGQIKEVLLTPAGSPAANYGFDVTPARLVTGLITDRGVCEASEEGLVGLFPERIEGLKD